MNLTSKASFKELFSSLVLKLFVHPIVVGLVVTFGFVETTFPQSVFWFNPNGGLFSDGNNWNTGNPPNSTQSAVFALFEGQGPITYPITYTVNFNQNHINRALSMSTGHVTMNLFDANNTFTYTLSNGMIIAANAAQAPESSLTIRRGTLLVSNGPLDIRGNVGQASLHLKEAATFHLSGSLLMGHIGVGSDLLTVSEASTLFSQAVHIANPSGSTSVATVSGVGSKWHYGESMAVGEHGNGTLNIENGGLVSGTHIHVGVFENALGTVNITGAGSRWESDGWFTAGWHGVGVFNVENGGGISNSGPAYIARAEGSQGTVNITGSGSSWHNGNVLWVGAHGTGVLSVNDGGTVTSLSGSVGHHAGAHGSATVNGTDSIWSNHFDLNVGFEGTGILKVENGGLVTAVSGFVGRTNGSHGTIEIKGAGSCMEVDQLYIGGNEHQAAGQGIVNVVNGGKLIVNSQLKVWNTGRLNLDGGQLSVPYYEVDGTLSGSGTINGRIVVFGKISPGDVDFGVAGILKTGNLGGGSSVGGTDGQLDIKDTSTVSIQVGGTSGPGDSSDLFDIIDGLNESGLLIDGGFLELALINDFIPQSTDTFDIFQSFATVSGAFGNTVFGGPGQLERILFDQGSFAIEYGESYVRLSDFQMIPEPSAGLLVGLTLTGIGLYRRRYRCQVC